ncbi:hypothetical protein [Xanthomonas campestris]|uniref:hypothetical protein n=1 Tax=Xanthomonas campestris TaxID=339 RepID=UPI0013A5F195|nr:hypothetical protein [Xanthomonas campestris]
MTLEEEADRATLHLAGKIVQTVWRHRSSEPVTQLPMQAGSSLMSKKMRLSFRLLVAATTNRSPLIGSLLQQLCKLNAMFESHAGLDREQLRDRLMLY